MNTERLATVVVIAVLSAFAVSEAAESCIPQFKNFETLKATSESCVKRLIAQGAKFSLMQTQSSSNNSMGIMKANKKGKFNDDQVEC
jgi:hypothetical protein